MDFKAFVAAIAYNFLLAPPEVPLNPIRIDSFLSRGFFAFGNSLFLRIQCKRGRTLDIDRVLFRLCPYFDHVRPLFIALNKFRWEMYSIHFCIRRSSVSFSLHHCVSCLGPFYETSSRKRPKSSHIRGSSYPWDLYPQ